MIQGRMSKKRSGEEEEEEEDHEVGYLTLKGARAEPARSRSRSRSRSGSPSGSFGALDGTPSTAIVDGTS